MSAAGWVWTATAGAPSTSGGRPMPDSQPDAVARAYAAARALLGDFAHTVDLGPVVVPGAVTTDPHWLAERVRDTGRRWNCPDPRVAGTLWWYSASSTLVAGPVAMLLATGSAPDPDPARWRCTLRPDGYLGAVRSSHLLTGAEAFARALGPALSAIVSPLAGVSGASERALWAVASDSIANRALDAGRAAHRAEDGCALAAVLSVPPLMPPRFVDVGPTGTVTAAPGSPESGRRFVRRSSCCLIYCATDSDKCTSCPRRAPADRDAALRRYVAARR
ncbi:hypothetical protein [Rhodococcus rhodochrous]|uniref:Ferric siderophore reductase C-terminal domain-containing protein n=1 Tax=Rhodococcus rhodochrous KG-21 TaxID=1441923 RepID=A0A0M8PST8_RHORH|nr:hypothetical protein Z051_01555 [Rhodococcus rhodochrous KG-21]